MSETVAAQALLTPDAPALEDADGVLTYGELHRSIVSSACMLLEAGIGSEEIIGVWGDRTRQAITAILTVLAAGAAFLPLDSAYPLERLDMMVQDSGTRVVLGDGPELRSRVRTIPFEQLASLPAAKAVLRPPPLDSLAYVIYTSGSTGRPKGVMVPHRGISNVIAAQREILNLSPSDRVLQFASFSFDPIVFEMALAFGAGATLVLAPRPHLRPGEPLAATLENRDVTVVVVPPSSLAVTPVPHNPILTTIFVGGEACSEHVAERWRQQRRFFNGYGPTEATIWNTTELVEDPGTPSIGHPNSGVTATVFDDDLQPAPCGATGELYLGGVQVARGYLGDPRLTAERFVPDPGGHGARMYRTGDLVTAGEDHRLHFLGRSDNQVKVRGFRIELGEVEAALTRIPGILEAVVAVTEFDTVKRLTAHYQSESIIDHVTLRNQLIEWLPLHLVPGVFTRWPELPRTPNGKIDRDLLWTATPSTTASPSPDIETTLVRLLCRICARVLAIASVDPEQDFFEQGGDSLLATQFVNQIRDVLNVKVTLMDVFDAESLRQLSDTLSSRLT
ncbi:amino acid adenylation domain-containing protein [Catenulispora sp. EB89]|uniref:non-ribosomal peptide synthetase n=1 Tax=Catenulispora sp. EB89 TaxID=3156257 RepID=UPI003511C857